MARSIHFLGPHQVLRPAEDLAPCQVSPRSLNLVCRRQVGLSGAGARLGTTAWTARSAQFFRPEAD